MERTSDNEGTTFVEFVDHAHVGSVINEMIKNSDIAGVRTHL